MAIYGFDDGLVSGVDDGDLSEEGGEFASGSFFLLGVDVSKHLDGLLP
jgi:hypothetical protein